MNSTDMFTHTSEKRSEEPLLHLTSPSTARPLERKISRPNGLLVLVLVALFFILALPSSFWSTSAKVSPHAASKLEAHAWSQLKEHVSLLDVAPISRDEFLARQAKLATALKAEGVDAFIAEPSASTTYYANVSASFELSERPFLIILDVNGRFSYLAPKFELGRVAGLSMVYDSKTVIEWPEEESPYVVLSRATGYKKVMIDEHARFMIASGLAGAGIEVMPMTTEIQQLRSVKSEAELRILKGINGFTLQLVRSLQKSIKIGMTQEEITSAAKGLFTRAGVGKGFWAIVLFGAQAAVPHGGSHDGVLNDGEFVLIDIGSSLHGYGSDVTRTLLPQESKISDELMGIWKTVHAAQGAAIELMKPNETCSVVDAASRNVIEKKGYGEFFTHRLGHGLGLEMHEHPYLNGANGEKLRAGEVVTNEPGIYVTSEQARKISKDVGFGVRIEDAVLVTPEGGVVMTGSRAQSPYEP